MYFKPYLRYVLDQKTSAEYFKQRLARDELFQYLITVRQVTFSLLALMPRFIVVDRGKFYQSSVVLRSDDQTIATADAV